MAYAAARSAGGHRHDLVLPDRLRFLPVARAQTIGSGVPSADDDDVLAGRENLFAFHREPEVAAVLLRQEIHREVNTLQLAAGNARSRGCSAPPASTRAS